MRKLIQTFIALGSWGAFFWFIYFIYSYEPQDKIHDLNRTIKYYTVEDGINPSKQDLLKRGIIQFLQKEETLRQRIWEYRRYKTGYPSITYKPVGYYVLNNVGFSNWYEKLVAVYNESDSLSMEKILFNDFNASRVEDIAYCLRMDQNLTIMGMKRPIAFSYGNGSWRFFLDTSFILKERNNQYSFSSLSIFLIDGRSVRSWNHEFEYYLRSKKAKKIGYTYQIDKYGNVNYDIVKWFEEHKDLTGG